MRKTGFTLLELSIVLAIISALTYTSLSISESQDTDAKKRQTDAKLDTIEKAIAGFVAVNDRLPCPADTSTNANAGLEYCTGLHTVTSANSPTGYVVQSANKVVVGGLVPFRSLSLPEEMTVDGWGKQIEYAVTQALAGTGASYGAPTAMQLENSNMGLIIVEDITGAQRTNNAVYVLVSHGPNQYGGWNKQKTAQLAFPAAPDAYELENSHLGGTWNETFVASEPYGPSTTFDDKVRYKMKWQVVQEAGALLSNTVCNTAKTVIQTTDTTTNGAVYSGMCTYIPGDPNCPVYMNLLATTVYNLCLNK